MGSETKFKTVKRNVTVETMERTTKDIECTFYVCSDGHEAQSVALAEHHECRILFDAIPGHEIPEVRVPSHFSYFGDYDTAWVKYIRDQKDVEVISSFFNSLRTYRNLDQYIGKVIFIYRYSYHRGDGGDIVIYNASDFANISYQEHDKFLDVLKKMASTGLQDNE